jgi:hypothetical protein
MLERYRCRNYEQTTEQSRTLERYRNTRGESSGENGEKSGMHGEKSGENGGKYCMDTLSLGPGSYATLTPFGTHVEVELTPSDHAVFRAIWLSLGLNDADSLDLLEDGLRACGMSFYHLPPQCQRRRWWRGKGQALVCATFAGVPRTPWRRRASPEAIRPCARARP